MKIKELKDIIKDLPDDLDVIIANDEKTNDYQLVNVTSCGIVNAVLEDNNAFVLLSSVKRNVVDSVTSHKVDLLYDNTPEGGYPDNKEE